MSVWRGGDDAGGIGFGSPLLCAGRAARQLVVVVVEIVEEPVVPFCWLGSPGALQTARDRVGALAGPVLVLPAEALFLQAGSFRFGADVLRCRRRAVRLPDRVTADDERKRLLVVHRHAAEGLADELAREGRVRVAAGPFRVHVDETHVIGAERSLEVAFRRVASIAQPAVFRTPHDLFRLPARSEE